MKTRQGFVSNSSSSSFVVLGMRVSQKDVEKVGGQDAIESTKLYCDCPEGEDDYIIGKKIGRWSDDGGISHRDWTEVVAMVGQYEKEMRAVFPDLRIECQLIYGNVYG